jgi:hypothetical protein
MQNMLCVFGHSDVCPMSLPSELVVFSKFSQEKFAPVLGCPFDLQEYLKSGIALAFRQEICFIMSLDLSFTHWHPLNLLSKNCPSLSTLIYSQYFC